jgi:hypothetical protein
MNKQICVIPLVLTVMVSVSIVSIGTSVFAQIIQPHQPTQPHEPVQPPYKPIRPQQPPPGGWNPQAECNAPDSQFTCIPESGVTCDRQTGQCIKMSS